MDEKPEDERSEGEEFAKQLGKEAVSTAVNSAVGSIVGTIVTIGIGLFLGPRWKS